MFEMEKDFLAVLRNVIEKINLLGIRWALIGSTSLAVQGMNTIPKDIDIIIHHKDLGEVMEAFSKFNSSEPKEYSNKEGQAINFKMKYIEIHICADYDFGTYGRRFEDIIEIPFEDMSVPVFNLESEIECYEVLGKIDKAKRIKEFINS